MPNTEKKKKKKLEIKKMIYNFKTTKVQPTKARGGEAQWLGLCIHPPSRQRQDVRYSIY